MPHVGNSTSSGKSGWSSYWIRVPRNSSGFCTYGSASAGGQVGRIRIKVDKWLGKQSATKREILSLVGLLQHAAKVVRPGRTFVRHMYCTAAKVQEFNYYTRPSKEFRSDLYWWHILRDWNKASFLSMPRVPEIVIQSDASGSWGCAAFWSGKWLQ